METNFLKLYIDQNKALASTLVVKFNRVALSINESLQLKYGLTIDDNPATWKYYQNISGIYHTTDNMMSITSLDTLEIIDFTKDNLNLHPITKEAYNYPSRYYYTLLSLYPNQEQLILGILYPADIDVAISSEDGSIVSYPDYLVEPQEYTLISELESYIKRYLVRWDVQAYGVSDSLYNSAMMGVMYLNIYSKLLNLRSKRCMSNETHSFHIRQFLTSHGRLDRYLPYLTLKQSLYLYRNIRYIERNSGNTNQLPILIDKLLTDRYIPIADISVRHSGYDNNYTPNVIVQRKALNPAYNGPEKDYYPLTELYSKEQNIALANNQYMLDKEPAISDLLKYSTSSIIHTKSLESSALDYTDSVPDTLPMVLLRQWISMCGSNLLHYVVSFKYPGIPDLVVLNIRDALIFMYYIQLRSYGISIKVLPDLFNAKALRNPLPTIAQIVNIGDKQFSDLKGIAGNILSNIPHITNKYSASSFCDLSYKLYDHCLYEWRLTSSIEDYYKRGIVANMVLSLYQDERISFDNTEDMDQWLIDKGLPVYNLSKADTTTLITNIFEASTGLTIDNTKLLKNIQKALTDMLSEICSYSIQFLREINTTRIIPLNWAAIRTGNIKSKIDTTEQVMLDNKVMDVFGRMHDIFKIESDINKNFNYLKCSEHIESILPLRTDIRASKSIAEIRYAHFHRFEIDSTYPGKDNTLSNKVMGYEWFTNLTSDQKSQLRSIYN